MVVTGFFVLCDNIWVDTLYWQNLKSPLQISSDGVDRNTDKVMLWTRPYMDQRASIKIVNSVVQRIVYVYVWLHAFIDN